MTSLRELREDVDYLLGAVEMLVAAQAADDKPHPVDGWGVHWTPQERRVLKKLHDARGGVFSKEHLRAVAGTPKAGYEATPDSVYVLLCTIRRKLPPEVGEITTHHGRGYALHLAQG